MIVNELEKIAQKISYGLGFILISLEFNSKGKIISTYIHKHGGVSVSDCSLFSRHFKQELYVAGIEYYNLEVSSPGINRKISTDKELLAFKGSEIEIIMLDGSSFKAILVDKLENEISVKVNKELRNIPRLEISKIILT